MKSVVINIVCFPLLVIVLILASLACCSFLLAVFILKVLIIPTGIDETNIWKVNKKLDNIIARLWDYVDK